jgi:hypothetical protein
MMIVLVRTELLLSFVLDSIGEVIELEYVEWYPYYYYYAWFVAAVGAHSPSSWDPSDGS